MGGVVGTNYSLFFVMFIPLVLYFLIVAILLPQLDLFLTGDEIAHSRGINVNASRNLLIIATALAVGAIVSICGPIGFVGIIAPHACRMLFPGVRHRLLAFSSCLVGGTFLTLSDTIARTIIPPSEIPVGIITALFGGPFFLAVLIKRKDHLLM
jgi:iron complex transport system permease protein